MHFHEGPPINREISLVSGPGIPPRCMGFSSKLVIFPSLFGKDEDIERLRVGLRMSAWREDGSSQLGYVAK